MQLFKLSFVSIIAEHLPVDSSQQQPRRNRIEIRVVFDILDCSLNKRFIKLLGSNAIKQRQLQFGRYLRYLRNLIWQTFASCQQS